MRSALLLIAALLLCSGVAHAANLVAPPGAPAWQHFGANALLFAHIGGGTVGMLSGAATLSVRKGGRLHRLAGTVFFVSMFITYAIGAGVAPFLSEGQRPNFVAGVLALYLLVTGWMTVRTPEMKASPSVVAGLVLALAIVVAGAVFMDLGARSPTGTIDGSPPQAFILFTVAGTFAVFGEINVLIRRSITGAARVARHLWRLCFSLFIASGSFFLGQQQIMPAWLRDSPVLLACAFAPIVAMLFWLVWVRVTRRYRRVSVAA